MVIFGTSTRVRSLSAGTFHCQDLLLYLIRPLSRMSTALIWEVRSERVRELERKDKDLQISIKVSNSLNEPLAIVKN